MNARAIRKHLMRGRTSSVGGGRTDRAWIVVRAKWTLATEREWMNVAAWAKDWRAFEDGRIAFKVKVSHPTYAHQFCRALAKLSKRHEVRITNAGVTMGHE